jgi:hypothetical protein
MKRATIYIGAKITTDNLCCNFTSLGTTNQPHFAGDAFDMMSRSISAVGLCTPHKIAAMVSNAFNQDNA